MCCALHLLMFCFFLTYVKLTIPKRRVTTLPFPAWDARKYWSKIPSARLVNTPIQETLDALADRPFLGTHRCLELAYPLAFGEQLFPGRERCGTFRPLPSRPSGPVFQLKRRNLTFLRLRSGSGTLLSQVPPRADITRGLPRMPPASRTHAERGKMQRLFRRVRDCLGCTAFELPKDEHTDRTFVAIHTTTYW